jgi:SprT protein
MYHYGMENKEQKMSTIEQHLIERVAHYCNVIREKLPKLAFQNPEVGFEVKGRTAGLAYQNGKRVAFNTVLAEENRDEFDNTIIHELAHLVTFKLYPRAKQNHGPEFKRVFVFLGGNGKRGHTYDVCNVINADKVKKRFVYKCNCQVHQLTSIRHNRIVSGKQTYSCGRCHVRLTRA